MSRSGAQKANARNQRKEKEEGAGDLKPKNAAHSAERPQKSAQAAGDACAPDSSIRILIAGWSAGCGRWWRGRGRPRAGGNALTGDASRDPQPDSQRPAYLLWFHLRYDGSSGGCVPHSGRFLPQHLLWEGIGSNV